MDLYALMSQFGVVCDDMDTMGDDRELEEVTVLGNVDGAEYHIIDVVLDKDGMIKIVMDPKIPVQYPETD